MTTTNRDPLRIARRYLQLVPCMIVVACGAENVDPPPIADADTVFWALELNHHAVAMSTVPPYDTLSLEATPRNHQGETMHGLGAPWYVSRDPARVAVTREGRVVALGHVAAPVAVIATLTVNDVTHADTVMVVVDDQASPPRLKTFSAHPVPPDSAKTGSGPLDYLPLFASDSNDVPLAMTSGFNAGYPVRYRSSDPTVGSIDPTSGAITGSRPGRVTMYASTTLYGIAKADTVAWRIGWPIMASLGLAIQSAGGLTAPAFFPSEVIVGTGAVVSWVIHPPIPETDITFDDDDVPNLLNLDAGETRVVEFSRMFSCGYDGAFDCEQSGNIMLGPTVPGAFRTLAAPGIYEYRSVALGVSGRVIVVDER